MMSVCSRARWLQRRLPGCACVLLLLTATLCRPSPSVSFDLDLHCAQQCLKFQGGNVCNCDKTLFSGKRSSTQLDLSRHGSARIYQPDYHQRQQQQQPVDLESDVTSLSRDYDESGADNSDAMFENSQQELQKLYRISLPTALKRFHKLLRQHDQTIY